jgi:hypothetical protein
MHISTWVFFIFAKYGMTEYIITIFTDDLALFCDENVFFFKSTKYNILG